MADFIKEVIPFLIPVLAIPLVMRFIIAPILLFRLKNRYLKEITSTIKDGWVDSKDLKAIEYIEEYAWKGLNSPFVISYNFKFLEVQLKTLLAGITSIYNDDSNGSINLKFSIQKILETLFLLFDDVHNDFQRIKIYKMLEKLPVNIFLRVNRFNRSFKFITQNRIIKILQKYRITVKVLRFILIPILGLPLLIIQLIFSLLYSTIFEGYIRFIYGVILIKTGYYTIYLYSNRKSSLHKRNIFDHKEIVKKGKLIEERHARFKHRYIYSQKLDEALKTLNSELGKIGIIANRETQESVNNIERLTNRAWNTLKNTVQSELNMDETNNFNFKPIIDIFYAIGKVYYPKANKPLYHLRVKEALELGYFITTVSLKNIYNIPASKQILDRIPLQFVFDISEFIDNKNIKQHIPKFKFGTKLFRNLRNYYTASRLLVQRTNPAIFVASMVTPILSQQIIDSIREYIFNISGLLLIDSYESTLLKDKENKIKSIFE